MTIFVESWWTPDGVHQIHQDYLESTWSMWSKVKYCKVLCFCWNSRPCWTTSEYLNHRKEWIMSVAVVFGNCLLILLSGHMSTLQHRCQDFGEVSTASASTPCSCLRMFFAEQLSLNPTSMQALQVSPQRHHSSPPTWPYIPIQSSLFTMHEYLNPVSLIIHDPPSNHLPITHTRFSKRANSKNMAVLHLVYAQLSTLFTSFAHEQQRNLLLQVTFWCTSSPCGHGKPLSVPSSCLIAKTELLMNRERETLPKPETSSHPTNTT